MTSSMQAVAPYRVREAPGVTREEWNSLVQNSPGGGHVFQSHEWGEFKRKLGWKPVRLVLERDGEVAGAGQFLLYKTLPVPGYLMYSAKGPWLPWEDEAAVRTFFDGAQDIAAREGAHTVKVEPEFFAQQKQVKDLLGDIGFQKFRWDLHGRATMAIDLTPSEDELMKNMKKDTRYGVRRAGREGVEVVEDNSPEARDAFWKMFEETAERKGFWYRPKKYGFAAWQSMYDTGRAHLFFAVHEGERLAGAMTYTFGKKCWYVQAAAVDHKRNLQPTYLLQWEIMRWAKQNGVTRYDMMAIPAPDEMHKDHPWYGVYKFKLGFGGEVEEFTGCLDLPVNPVRAKAWNRIEPTYYRAHQRIKGDIYY